MLTICLPSLQGDLHGHLHVRVGDEGDGQGLHPRALHLPQGRLELARLHRHHASVREKNNLPTLIYSANDRLATLI